MGFRGSRKQFSNEFDASKSTGHLCAATVENFEQVLDGILDGKNIPSELTRISISVNTVQLSTYALNDILIAHPCPAAVSRFSFRLWTLHGLVKRVNVVYIDGYHICHSIQDGYRIEIFSRAPILKVFLPTKLLSLEKT
ncbi:hypothetical protein L6164_005882 [Bauhinia variegata]|uniref:Uncharacterized protein n=1 Tax=Bauhinia variegata TaxID=167791 RepID=A0ACB9PSL7_BAUVA|nr:hypothetical protein L6164_005882 [Bauhinia variegata]